MNLTVAYTINVDGWTRCETARPPVLRGYGPIEISERAWMCLSRGGDHIPCASGLTDTEHLIARAKQVDAAP